MLKNLKMKIAARRIEKIEKKTSKAQKTDKSSFGAGVWTVVSWPFRAVRRLVRQIWSWIRCIDLIGLINLTLLASIIALFSVLIANVVNCDEKTVVFVAAESVPVSIMKTEKTPANFAKVQNTEAKYSAPAITPPLKKAAKPCCHASAAPMTVKKKTYVVNGNLIIDGEFPGEAKLSCGAKINGSLYLQNMRRYTLPCGTVINGDLFLRNINMLKFCGAFTVKGNIYVSRNSSFGPIPGAARVGGQVIL
jgi:hypothetical protein